MSEPEKIGGIMPRITGLVRCPHYGGCDLEEMGCAIRYAHAQAHPNAIHVALCRTCDDGKERAAKMKPQPMKRRNGISFIKSRKGKDVWL